MLDGMRKISQHWIGRAILTVLFGLLIVSFVIWGVGDMFRGFVPDKVAEVGGQSITAQQYQNSLQTVMFRIQSRTHRNLTSAQAHELGLDRQVLGNLIADAALDLRAASLGMAISEASIVAAVRSDPSLQDASGQFNPALFDQALRDSGLSERGFFAAQSRAYMRQQIETPLIDGLAAPKPLVDLLARVEAQTRAIDYVVLPPSAAGDIPAPADDALKAYFNERKDQYRAPEYRALDILLVDPNTLANPADVSDEDAKADYDKVRDARFATPEKRKLQQIVFPDQASADDAEAKIKAGASFDDIVKARNLKRFRRRSRRDHQGGDVRPDDRRRRIRAAAGRRQRGRQGPVRSGDRARRQRHAGQREDLRRGQGHAEEGDRRRPRRRPGADDPRQDRGRARLGQDARRSGQDRRPRRALDRCGRRPGPGRERRRARPA